MNRPPAPTGLYVLRAVVLALAGASIALSSWLTRDDRGSVASAQAESTFACPMHPHVLGAAPSECPICGMALERREGRGAPMPQGGMSPSSFLLRPAVPRLTRYDLVTARRLKVARVVAAPAWLESADEGEALVYRDEATAGADARFAPARAGAGEIVARLAIELAEPWDELFIRVRFHLAPGDPPRGPGEVGWLRISIEGKAVTVPYSAVLESPRGPEIFVASADGRTLTHRAVDVSRLYFGQATAVAGLAEGEAVAQFPFAMAAEERLSPTSRDRAQAPP